MLNICLANPVIFSTLQAFYFLYFSFRLIQSPLTYIFMLKICKWNTEKILILGMEVGREQRKTIFCYFWNVLPHKLSKIYLYL